MHATQTDLSALRRGLAPPAPADSSRLRIPMPPIQWRTRIALPGLIFVSAAAMLLYAGRDVLTPAIDVEVVPVVSKAGAGGSIAGAPAGMDDAPGGKGASSGRDAAPTGPIVTAPGWVEADPYSTAVSALINGVVAEVLVLDGETVTAGQVVAKLVDDDARLALQQAEAELKSAAANVAEAAAAQQAAQRDWDNPIELTRRTAAAKAGLQKAQAALAQWPADLAAAEAQAADRKAEYDLLARVGDAATQIETLRSKLQYEAAKAEAEAIRLSKPSREAEIDAMKAELAAAEENLRLRIDDRRRLDEATAKVDQARAMLAKAQAARDIAALELDRTQVRSPYSGVVMARLVEPGSKVMFNSDGPRMSQIVRLYDPKHLQARVDIPLADAAHVGVGDRAEIVVQVLPDRVFKGEVTRIVHEADIQRNTIQVKVRIDDPAPQLKPEMLARARFIGRAAAAEPGAAASTVARGGLFAPPAAIRNATDGKATVWVVDQRTSTARKRAVELGSAHNGDWVEVAAGLAPGDRLITSDAARLSDGARVHIVAEANATAQAQALGSAEGHHGAH